MAKDGVEVVCGWRKDRKDKSRMVVISRIFNKIMGYFYDLNIHDYNCGLKLYTREAAKSLRLYGGLIGSSHFLPINKALSLMKWQYIMNREICTSNMAFQTLERCLPDILRVMFLTCKNIAEGHYISLASSEGHSSR